MPDSEAHRNDFPLQFRKIAYRSLLLYKKFFLNYFILAALSYLPFFIFNLFAKSDLTEFIEPFHGGLLDIIVFLNISCLYIKNEILPFETILLFVQKFFASAVLIGLIQLVTLVSFIKLLSSLGLFFLLVGIIPYIFLIFSGFFLIMENSPRLISVRSNLINSVKLVKKAFFPVFWNCIIITLLTIIPLFAFSVWYFSGQTELTSLISAINSQNDSYLAQEKLFETVQGIIEQSSFQWGRAIIHIISRPIKSIFLSLFFLGLISHITPQYTKNFLGKDA